MSENAFDPPKDVIPPEEVKTELIQFSVNIAKADFLLALENQKKWQELWQMIIPGAAMKAAMDMKYFVVNGFKPLENMDQQNACTKKIQELERPLPQIQIMPTGAKVPDNIKKAIGNQGHKLNGRQ